MRFLYLVVMVILLSSCGTSLKMHRAKKQLDVTYQVLDSINKDIAIKDLYRGIQKIEDNSIIKVTKYSLPDTLGHQAVDYVMEIQKDIEHHTTTHLQKDEVQIEHSIYVEESTDNSIIDTKEKYEAPPTVQALKHIKGIVALILIAYILYKFKKTP